MKTGSGEPEHPLVSRSFGLTIQRSYIYAEQSQRSLSCSEEMRRLPVSGYALRKTASGKEKTVKTFKGICPVHSIKGMKEPYHYRNKVHAVFDRDRRGNIISGVYENEEPQSRSGGNRRIADQKVDEIIGTIRGMLKSFKIRTYDEDTGYGLLRHVLVKRGFATGRSGGGSCDGLSGLSVQE